MDGGEGVRRLSEGRELVKLEEWRLVGDGVEIKLEDRVELGEG
jgi:hypothetical protein